jgi:hypothetical protein
MRRIQKFLQCNEINPTIISSNPESNAAIEICGNSNFHWGVNKDDH